MCLCVCECVSSSIRKYVPFFAVLMMQRSELAVMHGRGPGPLGRRTHPLAAPGPGCVPSPESPHRTDKGASTDYQRL